MSLVFATKSKLTAIANAIRTRSGSASSMTLDQMAAAIPSLPNTYSAGDEGKVVNNGALVSQTSGSTSQNGTVDTTLINSLTVNVSTSREDLTVPKDVDFIDYDGRLLYSYTAQEFANLSALPANPTNSGLTAQGWNWTLADAKTFVATYGALVIGQNYTTSDGKTRLYISIPNDYIEAELTTPVYLYKVTSCTGTLDWGDGSEATAISGTGSWNTSHTYTSPGDYIITIQLTAGSARLGYQGSNQTVLSSSGIQKMLLKKAEIGQNIIGLCRNTFYDCVNLQSVSIPTWCTDHDTGTDGGMFCATNMKGVVFPASTIGQDTQLFGNSLLQVAGLRYISIPKNMNGFRMLTQHPRMLRKLIFPSYTTSTILDVYMYNASSLTHYIVPGTYQTIKTDRMRDSLVRKLTIPATVTKIEKTAFQYNSLLTEVHLLPTTPPTLDNTNAFANGPANRVYYVPYSADHSALTNYQSATNWSTYASQMQEEPQ